MLPQSEANGQSPEEHTMCRLPLAVLSVTLVLGADVAPRAVAAEKERVYKGKAVSEWIAALKKGDTRWSKSDIILILGEIGSDAKTAVPVLIEALKDERLRYF